MKNILCVMFILILLGGIVIAQQSDGQAGTTASTAQPAQAAPANATQAAPVIPNVKTPLGELSIDGRVITGFLTGFYHQYGEDFSLLAATNAEMGESRAELAFHLKNGNFGEYIMLRAQNYNPNQGFMDGNYNPANNTSGVNMDGISKGANFAASIPYFLAYGNFFDNKLKVSVGKLYDENFVTRERIWKTEGNTNGGFYFSREGYPSIRLQFMPIKGLDVGGQLFFVNANARYTMNLMGLAHDDPKPINANAGESLKEWGLGASYTSTLFNAQLGVRLDGGVDPMNKYESKTYLKEYFGDSDLMDPSSTAYFGSNPVVPHYKHWNKLNNPIMSDYPVGDTTMKVQTGGTAAAFSDGAYAFMGFNLKVVKNLTVKVQGQLNNITAFDEFGYGVFDETIGYNIMPKFYAGIVMFQEFYGSDVFDDAKYATSPFFRFMPVVSYQLTPKIKVTLETTVGFCEDVLETPYFHIKPKLDFALAAYGAFRAQIFYEFESVDYKAYKGTQRGPAPTYSQIPYANDVNDFSNHSIGLGVDFMF
ncbi:MAG: hypothetical protein LBT13_08460 [Treponema sp.]|nr:hypothetical protein [Treponema sp.]